MFCAKCGNRIDSPGSPCPRCGEPTRGNSPDQWAPTVVNRVDPMIGQVVGTKYRIEGLLGAGGMGRVYRARRLMIGDVVALKLMQPIQGRDPKMIARFQREAQAAARLKHQNVVTVYDFGVSDDGSFYLVMELVEGQSLRTVMREQGPLPPMVVAKVVEQVCSALDEAHRQNIVHRDIKPDNIMVDFRGDEVRVKVLDFGIARMRDFPGATATQSTMPLGTPHYMSPEQCLGEDLDGRSDIYSMGIVTFEMLAGVVPFNSPTSTAVVIQHVNQDPPSLHTLNVSIPEAMEKVVLHALAKRREDRPQTAEAFAEEFRAVAEGQRMDSPGSGFDPTVPMPPPIQSSPPEREKRSPRRRVALVVAALLLSAGVGTVLVLRRHGPTITAKTIRTTKTEGGGRQQPPVVMPFIQASAATREVHLGQKLALRWNSSNSTRVVLQYDGHQIPLPVAGNYQIQPAAAGNQEADLTAYGANGKQATARVAFQVLPPTPPPKVVVPAPAIEASVAAEQVHLGQPVSVRWNARNASSVALLFAGKEIRVPLAGQHQFLPSNAGPGQVYLIAFGANGQQATSRINFQVLPHARPTVMILSPRIQTNGIGAQAVTSSLVQRLMGQGYQVLSAPYPVNSIGAAEQLRVSERPDFVVQASLSSVESPLKPLVTNIFLRIKLYDVTVNCSATIQMTQISNGQIVAQGTSSKSFHRHGVNASSTNQAALELAQQGLQQVLQDAMNQIPPPRK